MVAKLGMGGINKGIITPEGIERGLNVLKSFRSVLDENQINRSQIKAFGTSALRNASNGQEVAKIFEEETDIEITIISGDREAELIYEGVKRGVNISHNSLIVDIGGGSVEFILCNAEGSLWRKSIEIGGQRLMEKFFNSDPISPSSIGRMDDYFREQLLPLANAIHQYQPITMIGSSGSFDTLYAIYYHEQHGELLTHQATSSAYPLEAFVKIYEKLLTYNREERLAIPGMIEMRVDMIVVAVCLIRYLIQNFNLKDIIVSKYALKEGIMSLK